MTKTKLHTIGLTALAAMSLSACETTGVSLPSSFQIGSTFDAAAKVTAAATQVQGWCFNPPSRRDFDGMLAEASLIVETQNYNNNNNKYEICRLKTPAKQLVAAAEVSKFTLVEVAEALAAIAEAEQLKSDTITELAERLKVTPATSLDIKAENELISSEIAKLQAEKSARDTVIELSPEAYVQIQTAQARLDSAASYLGQTLGTTIVIYRTVSAMSQPQREAVLAEASGMYQGTVSEAAFEGFLGSLGQIAQGTTSGAGGLMSAAIKLGEVEKPENVGDVDDAVDAARRITNEEAVKLVEQIDSGSMV